MDKLTLADFQRAASKLGVDVASVRAITEVESRGSGFLRDGTRPVILFERHVFRKQLIAAGYQHVDAVAQQYPGICNAKTGGYLGGEKEWNRFALASSIRRSSAIESCSWGMFQLMGYHWRLLGYASAQDFLDAMYRGEADHLDAFVRFVLSQPGMLKALRARDWPSFAKLYNGPAYKTNNYDTKLAAAYKKHAVSS